MVTYRIMGLAPYWPNAPDRPDVKIKTYGLGQYGAEPILRYHFGNFVH